MTEPADQMHQVAPYPHALAAAVEACTYRQHEGWKMRLGNVVRDVDSQRQPIASGLTLVVTTKGFDTYDVDSGPGYQVNHFFIVPAATYTGPDWERWLFEQLLKVETHECMENFLVDGRRPFPPTHGAGRDPYTIRELVTDGDAATRFDAHIEKGS